MTIHFSLYVLCLSTFFLMNLFSASVYHSYGRILHRLDIHDEKREEMALWSAWKCLDYENQGFITKQVCDWLIC